MALSYDDVLSLISIQTVVLLVFLIILALWLLKSDNNFPPGPRGWPIVGSMPYMFGEPHETFEKWTRIYGDIFTVKLGSEPVVILNSSDVVKEALNSNGDKFIDRPLLPILKLGYTVKGGVIFVNGHPWLELRRWSSSFLRDYCHGKKGSLGRQLNLESQLTIEAEHLCQEFGKHEKPFNPFHYINNAVSNVITAVCFGDRYEYSDPKYKELLEGIRYLLKCSGFITPLQNEVDEVIGQKKPKWSDRHSMPYLEATIMEIQRLGNVTPFFGRSTTGDVKISGYTIPADTTVLINLFSVHRHAEKWERPLNFEPERFLSGDLKTIRKQEPFLPFGLGRRLCIGDLMSRMEVFLFTANLIQRFDFKVPERRCAPSVNDCLPGLTRRPKPFEICATRR
ncbi:cytochrome P450 2J6-like isoform X2 [Antedon mediterranea]|uniref:cytochrome P450 2J6-like isoform X2 n=1 Tax=Antedon mediterranea TaxID=105859 RepID=UPI003AF7ECC4